MGGLLFTSPMTKYATLGAFTLLTFAIVKKSRHLDPTIYTFLVGSAHVRSQATVHACSACSMHEGRGYRYTFQRARVASSPEVPKVTWWKIATFLGYHLHWLTLLETSRHFRKITLRLGIFLAMFRECLCVVARQLARKCRDFSNVAKLARQCKWPYWTGFHIAVYSNFQGLFFIFEGSFLHFGGEIARSPCVIFSPADTSYCIHILWEVCCFIFFSATLYYVPKSYLGWIFIGKIWWMSNFGHKANLFNSLYRVTL